MNHHLALIAQTQSLIAAGDIVAAESALVALADAEGDQALAVVLAQLPPHREGVLDVAVQGMRGLTPYVRTGNLPVLLIAIGLLIASWRQARPRAAIQ